MMMLVKLPRSQVAAVLLLACAFAPSAPALPPPSPSPPVFQDRPFGPKPAPTPPRPSVVRSELRERLPRAWIVGGAAFVTVVAAAVLFFAIRAWRISRLFGRQYLFPVREKVALRLGGERSGGLVATARFGDDPGASATRSEAKDA